MCPPINFGHLKGEKMTNFDRELEIRKAKSTLLRLKKLLDSEDYNETISCMMNDGSGHRCDYGSSNPFDFRPFYVPSGNEPLRELLGMDVDDKYMLLCRSHERMAEEQGFRGTTDRGKNGRPLRYGDICHRMRTAIEFRIKALNVDPSSVFSLMGAPPPKEDEEPEVLGDNVSVSGPPRIVKREETTSTTKRRTRRA